MPDMTYEEYLAGDAHQHKTNRQVVRLLDRMAGERSVTRAKIRSLILAEDEATLERFFELVRSDQQTCHFDFLKYCDTCRKFSLVVQGRTDGDSVH